ncbi:MAG: site-specific integrase [Ferrovibrio sp.]
MTGAAKETARRCKRVREWPSEDQRLWREATASGGVFDSGTRADYAPVSLSKLAKGYGRWLTWLDETGELDGDIPPADRFTEARAQRYTRHLADLGNKSSTVANRLRELLDAGLTFAPDQDWSWLRNAAERAKAAIVPARNKAPRIVSADSLLDLGLRLMAESAGAGAPVRQSTMFRDGLMIAFLALCPLRGKNLAAMQIGTHLVKAPDGKGWLVEFKAGETKARKPIRLRWPGFLDDYLTAWLEIHRPRLAQHFGRWHADTGQALWLSHDGSPLTQASIYCAITKRTRQAFGHSVNPHLFRDCAATTLGIVDPAHIHAAAPLLGHASLATTQTYYQQAEMHHAVGRYQDSIMRTRKTP